jgi:hypothetical protein
VLPPAEFVRLAKTRPAGTWTLASVFASPQVRQASISEHRIDLVSALLSSNPGWEVGRMSWAEFWVASTEDRAVVIGTLLTLLAKINGETGAEPWQGGVGDVLPGGDVGAILHALGWVPTKTAQYDQNSILFAVNPDLASARGIAGERK